MSARAWGYGLLFGLLLWALLIAGAFAAMKGLA